MKRRKRAEKKANSQKSQLAKGKESESATEESESDSGNEEVTLAIIDSCNDSSDTEEDSFPLTVRRSARKNRTSFKTRQFWGDSDN